MLTLIPSSALLLLEHHLTSIQALPLGSDFPVELCWDTMPLASRLSIYNTSFHGSESYFFFLLKQRFNQRSRCRTYNLVLPDRRGLVPFVLDALLWIRPCCLCWKCIRITASQKESRFCYLWWRWTVRSKWVMLLHKWLVICFIMQVKTWSLSIWKGSSVNR